MSAKLLPEIWILSGWFGGKKGIGEDLFSWELEASDALLVGMHWGAWVPLNPDARC